MSRYTSSSTNHLDWRTPSGLAVLGLAFLLGVLTACGRADAGTPNATAAGGGGAKSPSSAELQEAVADGRLHFEIRGLANEAKGTTYGGTNYQHNATVVVTGDSALSHQPMLLIYQATRVAGGDPGALRDASTFRLTQVTGGVGTVTESGGYRTKEETWDPEKIELRIIGVLPITLLPPTRVATAREQ